MLSEVMMTSAEELLVSYNDRLEPVLRGYLDRRMEDAWTLSPDCREMLANVREFTLRGGKRIRPALVYYAYRCFEQDHDEDILFASAAVEFLHSYLLIHDDIMDEDDLRRGRSTMHKTYADSTMASRYKSREAYGNAMAIIAGDIASAMATDVLTIPDFPPDRRLRAINKLSDITITVCHGQALDILSSCREDCREEDAELVNRLKTACYTVEGPLHIGGILAGASDADLRAFSDYALPLGQAFQIMDDILGLYGDEHRLGKPIGSDLREGKKPLLILKALEIADDEQVSVITQALGDADLTSSEIEAVRTAVSECGALDYCHGLAESLAKHAQTTLPGNLSPEGRDFLVAIADYVVNRER